MFVMGSVFACTRDSGADGGSSASSSSSSSSSGAVDAGPPPTAAEYCARTVEFFCSYYLRCGRMAAASADECRATFMETCAARYQPRYAQLADAGLLSLSAAGIEACRAHLGTVECARQIRDLDGPCGAMWVGHQPVGGPCGIDVESLVCAAGSACVLGLDFCGTCRALAAVGETCGGDITCGQEAACVDGNCVPRGLPGDGCADGGRCVVGASCVAETCTGPAYVAVGDSCDQSHRCPYRSVCAAGTCARTSLQSEPCGAGCASGYCAGGTCAAPLADGAVCTASSECASYECVAGHCAPLPGHCFHVDGGA